MAFAVFHTADVLGLTGDLESRAPSSDRSKLILQNYHRPVQRFMLKYRLL
jgi:hypothetical protein